METTTSSTTVTRETTPRTATRTSTTSSTSSTLDVRIALTTQFVQPSGCANIRDVTSIAFSSGQDYIRATILLSNPTDPRFTTCQPPGWQSLELSKRFTFSPAVCPMGWTAYGMRAYENSPPTTYGVCCTSGHTPLSGYFNIPGASTLCLRQIGSDVPGAGETHVYTKANGTGATATFTEGYLAHPAWNIEWQEKDVPTLTPAPPIFPVSAFVPTWVPGEPIDMSKYDPSVTQPETRIMLFLCVGVPLIGLTLISSIIWLCCRAKVGPVARWKAEGEKLEAQSQARSENPADIEMTVQTTHTATERSIPPSVGEQSDSERQDPVPPYSPVALSHESRPLSSPTAPTREHAREGQPPSQKQSETIT